MKKEHFKELLTDLYSAYNPDFIKFVPQLVEKYNRLEFDAIQNILIKYNHDSYEHFDKEKTTDKYIHSLIKDYSNGNKSLNGFTIEMQIKRNKKKEANKTEEEINKEKELKKETEKELSGIKGKLSDTEKRIDVAQKELDEKLKKINEQINNAEPIIQKTSLYDDVEISINSNYTETELILPNKKYLAGLGKGTRIIVNDKNNKPIGLIIDDILYDCISHPLNIPIIEILIKKG